MGWCRQPVPGSLWWCGCWRGAVIRASDAATADAIDSLVRGLLGIERGRAQADGGRPPPGNPAVEPACDQVIGQQDEPDQAARAYRLRHQRFPRERSATMPTRLGNVFQAAESYPADSRLYGMDAVFFWPRLYPLLPEPLRAELASARSAIDMMLVTSVLSTTLSLGVAADGVSAHLPVLVQILAVAGLLAVSRGSYLGAVNAAIVYAELVRTSFDLYRRSLLSALGLALPGSLAEEQRLWRAVGQLLYRRHTTKGLRACCVSLTTCNL